MVHAERAADEWNRMAVAEKMELRREARTAMFVAATLRAGGRVWPIRIRNMSANGALVEGADLPLAGTAIDLVRGSHTTAGTVAWSGGGRAGLLLGEHVVAGEWMARQQPAAPAPAHQAAVDELVQQVRRTLRREPPPGDLKPTFDQAAAPPGEELAALISRLEKLGEELVADPAVAAAHGETLQTLDEVQQRLDALRRRLG